MKPTYSPPGCAVAATVLLAAALLCLARACRTPVTTPRKEIIWTGQSTIFTYDVRTGWFTPARKESQMRDEAMRRAQELVEAAAGSGENLRLARDTAEKWLQAFFGQLGWHVKVEWK